MVDINAKLTVEISVENYDQIVKNDKGRFLGAVTKVPGVNSFVKGKVDGFSLRVPTPTVSVVDFTADLARETTADELNTAFREAAA